MPRRATRTLSAGAALLIAGASVLVTAAPAAAATFHVPASSIAPDETTYLGWHAQIADGGYVDAWDGLRVADSGDTYLLHGLVTAGSPGELITADELGALITSSQIAGEGNLRTMVPFSIDTTPENPPAPDAWGTLRSTESTANTSPELTDEWISSRTIGGTAIVANIPMALGDILTELDQEGLRYSGFGFYAVEELWPGIVSSVTWGEDTFTFGRVVSSIPSASTTIVGASDIAPDETEYTGWHEGYDNATPAFSVASNGLSLGNGANSQIINGLETPLATTDPFSLITSASVTVVSGEAFYQVPVFFGPDAAFATLRPATGAGPGTTGFELSDLWISSREIPGVGSYPAIAANFPVPLGYLLDRLVDHGDVEILAFGVLAQESAPTVVSAIVWNGVTYSFLPTLAATGADTTLALSAAGALILAGGAVMLLRSRRPREV